MKITTLLLAATTFYFSLATPSNSAELCFNMPVKDWLVGKWSFGTSIWIFKQDGDAFVWSWVRGPGEISPRWGLKKTAEGEGKVSEIEGCRLQMIGEYTSYDDSPSGSAVGNELVYKLEALEELLMKGTGYGFGKSEYSTLMHKVEPAQGKSGETLGPSQLANINGSFKATGKVICSQRTFKLNLTGKVENGSVTVTGRTFGPDQIKIVEDGKFKKNVGPTRTGKTDILIKGRVRQGEIDIGLYLVRPGTEQIYCVGKDTIALK